MVLNGCRQSHIDTSSGIYGSGMVASSLPPGGSAGNYSRTVSTLFHQGAVMTQGSTIQGSTRLALKTGGFFSKLHVCHTVDLVETELFSHIFSAFPLRYCIHSDSSKAVTDIKSVHPLSNF